MSRSNRGWFGLKFILELGRVCDEENNYKEQPYLNYPFWIYFNAKDRKVKFAYSGQSFLWCFLTQPNSALNILINILYDLYTAINHWIFIFNDQWHNCNLLANVMSLSYVVLKCHNKMSESGRAREREMVDHFDVGFF